MLEIFVDNKKIDLPSDIEINVTWENPFIEQDRIPLPYSMSFELPLTPKNLATYKNPDRQNSVGCWKEQTAQIRFNTISIGIGKMGLTEVDENLNTDFVGSFIPEIAKYKMNKLSTAKDFKFSFGAGRSRFFPDFTNGWAKLYKETIFNNSITPGSDFAACPVRVSEEEWEYDTDSYGIYNAGQLYLNFWNMANGNYLLNVGTIQYHSVIFPQPYIYSLFEKIFGSSLGNNFFKEKEELKTLCMVTSFHAMFNNSIMSTYKGILLDNSYYNDDIDNYFYLSSFMPKYKFSEFLKEILKMFCCSLIPKPNGKLDIVHNKDIVESTLVTNWTEKLTGTPTKSKQDAQIYSYGYSSESASDDEYYKSIDSIEDLLLDTTTAGTYQIKNTGEVIEKTLEDKVDEDDETEEDVFSYERQKTGLGGNTTEDDDKDEDTDEYDVSSAAKPIPMCIADYWTTNTELIRNKWNVPEFPDDRTKNTAVPYIGFVRGFYDVTTKTTTIAPATHIGAYPLLTPYAYDPAGNKVGEYSLAWEGNDGLINKFHTGFKTWVEKDKQILKGTFRLTAIDLKNIDPMTKITCNGKMFYYKKVEVTITKNKISLADVTLIEA